MCSREDARQLLQDVVRHKPTAVIFCDSIVTCEEFLVSCSAVFESLINVKAEKVINSLRVFSLILAAETVCCTLTDTLDCHKDSLGGYLGSEASPRHCVNCFN